MNPTTFCELGQSPGDWQAAVAVGTGYTAYVTDAAHKPDVGDPVPSPVAYPPAAFGFTKPNTNNVTVPPVAAGTGILADMDPATAVTLNFGIASSSCAIPPTP